MTETAAWWAGGTSLAERTAARAESADTPSADTPSADTPSADTPPADTPSAEGTRPALVEAWRSDYSSAADFRHSLAELGLTEGELSAMAVEPPELLAARLPRPAWAATAELAVAAAPVAPQAPQVPIGWQDGFALVLAPFAELAAARVPGLAAAGLHECFVRQLGTALVGLARRTLVLELNVGRVRGRLTGATPEARFADFVRQASSRTGLGALCAEYPVLARLLAQRCEQSARAWGELLARYAADRADLVATVFAGVDPGPLTEVLAGAGDSHQQGRSVALLRFGSGARLVYKPRPLAVHRHFNELAEWYGARLPGLGPRTLALLDRPGYGWVEHVSPAPCESRAQVRRFYRRLGALLALVHAVGGTDLHAQNLIACADHPVPVDLETLFQPALARPATDDPALAALEESVQRTALLPALLTGDHGALDVSALGGDPGSALPDEVPGWAAPGTDEMRLVRTAGVFPGADNRPRFGGATVDPAAHGEELISGFRQGHEAITAGRAELLGPDGLLARFAGDVTRVVLRSTRWYATLLDESTHPDVLRDALDRDRLLDVLRQESAGDAVLGPLAAAELACLWEGDVPLVSLRPGGDALTVGPVTVPGLLREPGLARAGRRLAGYGRADRLDQEWMIRATLAVRQAQRPGLVPPPAGTAAAVAPDPERLLAAAGGIADQLLVAAQENGRRVNWLGLELLDGRAWAVLPQGAGLPHGYCGTALFLAQLAALTGTERYADTARRALVPVPGLLASLAGRPGALSTVGPGYAGLGGIAYALARLAVLLDDPALLDQAATAVDLTAAALAAEPSGGDPSVLDGEAGCLAAMLAVRESAAVPGTASPGERRLADQAAANARRCADRLAGASVDHLPDGGFDTGTAGIGWALLRYGGTGGARYTAAGLAALGAAVAGRGDAGPDRARSGARGGPGWCGELTGTALALADTPGGPARLDAAGPATALLARALAAGPVEGDHSLCHGESGALELLSAAVAAGHADPGALTERAGRLLAALEQFGPRCGTPEAVSSPGLLTGLAGIGHGLLRLGFPESVPSALLLRPPGR
ncbi:type 2 lanthipeptide synthetase LanM family protein [Kitasatospora cineracea]|uniref:type 2 lanthipeptide synthetase LanM family protein n=1 Tax=Kitasatospora cineracea TaxID=88074 RepID=UPI0038171E46